MVSSDCGLKELIYMVACARTVKRRLSGAFSGESWLRDSNGARAIAVLGMVAVLAFTTRVLPSHISPLPFNNDGLSECRIAGDILESRHLQYPEGAFYLDTHSVITPIYNVMLAFSASVTGSSTYSIAQMLVGIMSILSIVGAFSLTLRFTGSVKGAIATAIALSLFGTAVFLTGSTWKESLGFALLVFFFFAYAHRSERRYLALEVTILLLLPFVHHLVMAVGYLSLSFLTAWSLYFAIVRAGWKRRHTIDFLILLGLSVAAYAYYELTSLDRLSMISEGLGILLMAVLFIAFVAGLIATLRNRVHTRLTFAPIPAIVILVLATWDYFDPIFPYVPGAPHYVLILIVAISVILSISWFGHEVFISGSSPYRALPLAMMLPPPLLIVFSLVSGFDIHSHQVFYRTFDFVDLSLAVGIGICLSSLRNRPRLELGITLVLVIVLLISFPFGYESKSLLGVRHDTQNYEVDAIDWIDAVSVGEVDIQSDERLSYIAMALYDVEKTPYLPDRLMREGLLGVGAYYVLEEEWMTVGVNDYPRGHPVLNETEIVMVLQSSNVFYCGGPSNNNVIVFVSTTYGQDVVFGYH